MKKILALTVLPLALASCNMFGVPNGDVSGNILGPQPSGTIRLALTEVSTSGIGETVIDQFNVRTFNPEKRAYIVSLKPNPTNGIYHLFSHVYATTHNPINIHQPKPLNRHNHVNENVNIHICKQRKYPEQP